MSPSTHVTATIRFDALRSLGDPPPNLFSHVPTGSEGPLETYLMSNPNSSTTAYIAVICGDLRDYDDVDAIVAYLARLITGRIVRQGVAEIEVEGRAPVVLRYADDGWVVG
jgi:hypothetical protein